MKYGAKEDNGASNIKITVGLIITGIVLLSHYYPLEFPKNYWLLVGCVISYFIISTANSIYEEKVIKDTFLACDTRITKDVNDQKLFKIKFGSKMELYTDHYDLIVVSNKDKTIKK